jgi:WD40 repeat protein/tetratricopeptide (TPR) repeat protein
MKHTQFSWGTFSPDGRRVLSKSLDWTVRVWDAATGQLLCDPMRHPDRCAGEFSPDGTRVATACDDHAVRIWDAATGRMLLPPLWHLAPVNAMFFSRDGRHVFTAGADQTVRRWDLAAASPTGRRVPEALPAFSPDGRLLITAGRDCMWRIWDASNGAPRGAPLAGPAHGLATGEFSPDGRLFAAMGKREDGHWDAWIWEIATRQIVAGPLFKEATGNVERIAWSADGLRLAAEAGSLRGALIRVWDARAGRPVTPELQYDDPVSCLEFNPDGRSLLVAVGASENFIARPGAARVIDATTGAPRFPPIAVLGACNAARFSRNGLRLITAATGAGVLESAARWGGEARVWDATTGRPLSPPMLHAEPVRNAFFSPDGRLAVTMSDAIRLWDAATGTPFLPPIRMPLPIEEVSVSRDGRRLLADCGLNPYGGFAQLFDVATGWPITPPLRSQRNGLGSRFSPDGRQVLTKSSGADDLVFWNLEPDRRPLDDLIRLAEILGGTRVDTSGAVVPISTTELQDSYKAILGKAPSTFTATPQQLLGWHVEQALRCETAGAWDAAVKHLGRLIEDGPRVDSLAIRRNSDLVKAYRAAGRMSEAAALVQATLKLRETMLGPEHPDTFAAVHALAHDLLDSRRLAEAEPLFRWALEGYRKLQGPDGSLTLDLTKDLAALLEEGSDHVAEAESLLRTVLDRQRAQLPAESPDLAGTLAAFGLQLLKREKWAEAEALLRECVAIREKAMPENWLRFNALSMLGEALLGQWRFGEAEALLLRGYEGIKQREAEIPAAYTQLRLAEASERITRLYETTHRTEQARAWRKLHASDCADAAAMLGRESPSSNSSPEPAKGAATKPR